MVDGGGGGTSVLVGDGAIVGAIGVIALRVASISDSVRTGITRLAASEKAIGVL